MARAASRSGARRGSTTSTPVPASTVTLTRRARSERLMRYGISAATAAELRLRPGRARGGRRPPRRPVPLSTSNNGRLMSQSRVKLPPGVRPPFDVYLNGVLQRLGDDYEVREGALVF